MQCIWEHSELQRRLLIYYEGMHLENLNSFLTLLWNSICPHSAALQNDINTLYIRSHSLHGFLSFENSFYRQKVQQLFHFYGCLYMSNNSFPTSIPLLWSFGLGQTLINMGHSSLSIWVPEFMWDMWGHGCRAGRDKCSWNASQAKSMAGKMCVPNTRAWKIVPEPIVET